jgi:hypothetical protein
MRRAPVILVAGIGMFGATGVSLGGSLPGLGPRALRHALSRDLGAIGGLHGAYVVDLTTGRPLFAVNTPKTAEFPRRCRSSIPPRPHCFA